jgi:hypothetical protein
VSRKSLVSLLASDDLLEPDLDPPPEGELEPGPDLAVEGISYSRGRDKFD